MKTTSIEQKLLSKRKIYLGIAIFVLIMFLFPLFIRNLYYLNVLIFVGIYTIAAIGLSLLFGYAGQISLGQAAFYGLGAYASGVLSTKYALNPWVAFVISILLVGVVAYLIGKSILSLSGHYLAMGTLGFGIIMNIIFVEWYSMTGGHSGMVNIPNLDIFGFKLNNDIRYYYFVWSVTAIIFMFSFNLVHSKVGRALRGISESEIASEVLGVNTSEVKVIIFVISAVYAAIAGNLYTYYLTFLTPDIFGFKFSLDLVIMVVLGGLGSIWGVFFGVLILIILPEYLRVLKDYDIIVYGIFLIVIVLFLPGGLSQLRTSFVQRFKVLRYSPRGPE